MFPLSFTKKRMGAKKKEVKDFASIDSPHSYNLSMEKGRATRQRER